MTAPYSFIINLFHWKSTQNIKSKNIFVMSRTSLFTLGFHFQDSHSILILSWLATLLLCFYFHPFYLHLPPGCLHSSEWQLYPPWDPAWDKMQLGGSLGLKGDAALRPHPTRWPIRHDLPLSNSRPPRSHVPQLKKPSYIWYSHHYNIIIHYHSR